MEKSNLLAVDIVVTDGKGNILLRKRDKDPDKGKWEIFGGYPFLDERPLEKAAMRILKIKGGIDEVESLEFTGKYYDDPNRHPNTPCIPLVFVAAVSKVETNETRKWFAPSEIKSLPMALDNKEILKDLGVA